MSAADKKYDNINILVAEDTEFNRLVLIDTLLDWNPALKIDIAENGVNAIGKASQKLYDLILMDIQMPVMNGYDAAKYIRNQLPAPFSKTPIIAITAHSLRGEERYCLEIGMDGYISKPFEPQLLFDIILNALNHSVGNAILPDPQAPVNNNVPLVNKDVIIAFTKGNKQRIIKMATLFLNDTPLELLKVKQLHKNKDYIALSNLCHSLRSRFAFMGIPEISEIAKKIEYSAKQKTNKKEIVELIERLFEQTELAYVEVRKMLAK